VKPVQNDIITALGIICLGTQTSKACFWDNLDITSTPKQPFDIARGESVSLTRFAGGGDLLGGNGVCSDCHAGQNPFVVHPGTPLDMGATLIPSAWYEPLIHPSWPQNPGPTTRLESITLNPSDRSCLTCHGQTASLKRRFPEVSAELPDYCRVVLKTAINLPVPPGTMPPGDVGNPNYSKHRDALTTACTQPPIPRGPISVVINGATKSTPGSSRSDTGGDLGPCTGGDCPIGFCYWRTLHGPFWQTTDSRIPLAAPGYRGSFVRIYAEAGRWKWRAFSDPTGLPPNAPPGGTAECMVYRNISNVPDPNNCFANMFSIIDPDGRRFSDTVDATVGGVTANVLSGLIGNVAQANFFGPNNQPDTLRVFERGGRALLTQNHTSDPPSPLRLGPLMGESWTNGCNAWTPTFAAKDIFTESDVQLVPSPDSRDAFCFITGITGAWSSTRNNASQQPFAEIFTGPGNDLRLRVFPTGDRDRVGAFASCIKMR
jgi:hypothetical protein